ncbi:MAG: thiamine phosphate synthase [Isosphaeraceae bacterium]
MFESFTAGAERALARAESMARRRGAESVEPLDLLAALTLETESRAAELMIEYGVEASRLWAAMGHETLEIVAGREPFELDPEAVPERMGPIPQSSDLKVVISEAMARARGIDRKREVGTEHLLAGLISGSDSAAELLGSAGLEFRSLREHLTETVLVDSSPLPLAEGIPPLELSEPGGGADLARILDASANRAREGLRVVEDYVRFALDDPGLTKRLKEIRHRLADAERGLEICLLIDSRDTREDVGTHIMTTSERIRENPRAVLAANFKRIAEALRSLEEYSKLVDVWLAGRFEVLRYDIYTVEKMTMTAVASHRSLGEARLMVLIGGLRTLGDLAWVVEEAIAGGADVIQYREKGVADRERLRRAREVRIITARARIPMIMNDRPDLARLAGCDGVHLGQEDLSVRDARRVLNSAAHVGVSTHDREQLDAAILAGASYLGVGPVFPSPTKEFSEPELAGLSYVRLAAESTALPWFAIGGINEENVDRVIEAGATRIAVSGAVVQSQGPRIAAARLKARLDGLDPDAVAPAGRLR